MESACSSSQSTRTLLRDSVTSSTTRRCSKIAPVSFEPRNSGVVSFLLAALCAVLAVGGVSAQDPLVFNTPQNLTLCAPTNLTWTGGVPPYRLDIEPFSPDNGSQEPSLDQRFLNITVQWLIWTPNFTAGTDVQFNVIDSTESGLAGGHHLVRLGSDTSCLPDASSSANQSPFAPATTSSSIATSTTPAPLFATKRGLSPGAIAGIAVAVAVVAVLAIAGAVWCVLRQRRQARVYKDFDLDRSVASPALSDTTTAVMHENYPSMGICSTLASTDRLSKAVTDTSSPTDTRFASYSGPSSPTLDMESGLRAIPYLVSRSSSPSGSLADLRRSRKNARDTAATSTNISSADLRSATPTQMSDTGSAGAPLASPRTIRFVEMDGGVRLAGEGVERAHQGEGEDAVSDAGTASLPPPYSPYQ
ncbi:hypothetical protein L227DRAFT_611128 [Lentinus tigrinus ALCF2SS1-6]|uniref:Uncharacterized protein n=2 Tax=Lentinus tigrinus TaxID=5365 RepID=A0A5C2SBE3_9APHY|nr:hypothetical protein L227DRAFT_611128 [Lentinus tigrinus ALCF2SS1-6]